MFQASDQAESNVHRLERMWDEHLVQNGDKSSLSSVIVRFCLTQVIVAMLFMIIGVIFEF
jgi:hypothetical protein